MKPKLIPKHLVALLVLLFAGTSIAQENTNPPPVDTLSQELIKNQLASAEAILGTIFKPVEIPAEDLGQLSVAHSIITLTSINEKKYTLLTALTDTFIGKFIIKYCRTIIKDPENNEYSAEGSFYIGDQAFFYLLHVESDCSIDFNASGMFDDQISYTVRPVNFDPLKIIVEQNSSIGGHKNKVEYDIADGGMEYPLISSFEFKSRDTTFRYNVPEERAKSFIELALTVMPDPSISETEEDFCDLPPTIGLLSPADGDSVVRGATFIVRAAVGGCPPPNDELFPSAAAYNSVTFSVDDIPLIIDHTDPYGFVWDNRFASLGQHSIKAVVRNRSGLSAETEVTVTIVLGLP